MRKAISEKDSSIEIRNARMGSSGPKKKRRGDDFNVWDRRGGGQKSEANPNCKPVELRPWSEGERKLHEAEEILSLPVGTRLFAETDDQPRRLFMIDLASLKKILTDWKENKLFSI